MFPLLQSLKNTLSFFAGKEMWKCFLPVLTGTSAFLTVMVRFFPFLKPDEQDAFVYVLDPFAIGGFLLVLAAAVVAVMVRAMLAIFFDKTAEAFWTPQLPKAALRFAGVFFKSLTVSLLFSAVCAWGGLTAMQKLASLPPFPDKATVLLTLMLLPYFLIRQCMRFPACVAGDDAAFVRGWRLSRRGGIPLCLVYLAVALLPIAAVFLMVFFLPAGEMFSNFFAVFAGLLSVMLQAAFMAYLYVRVKDDA